jgi:3-hydroxyacyl-CoA dehydrogenase
MSEGLSKGFKEHFLGTHFFNPVRYMHLLEIIPGEVTKKEILDFVAEFGESRLGKGIVWAKDTPNFVGNRIGIHGIGATMKTMLEEGLTIPEVDAIFGAPLGRPKTAIFATSDLVGLDTMTHVMKNTYDLCTDDEVRDVFKVPEFIQKMLDQKLLGNKTKAGFYKKEITPDWKKVKKVIDPKTGEYVVSEKVSFPCIDAAKKAKTLPEKLRAVLYGDDKGAKFAWKVQAQAFIYAANRIPEIADTIVEIDNAMKWGYNFEMGPFETWDAIGVKESVEKMERRGSRSREGKEDARQGRDIVLQAGERQEVVLGLRERVVQAGEDQPQGAHALQLQGREQDRTHLGFLLARRHRRQRLLPRVPLQDERHQQEMVDFMAKAGEYVATNGWAWS